tara:strand:- start:3593 stop:3814 length:222 start_codon:yes stop_codon:yes gene_type:complete
MGKRTRLANAKAYGEGPHACGGPKLSGLVSKVGKSSSLHHLFKGCNENNTCKVECPDNSGNLVTFYTNNNLSR